MVVVVFGPSLNREVLVNMALWVRQSSLSFARVRRSSHEGAHMLLVHPGTCLTLLCRDYEIIFEQFPDLWLAPLTGALD